VAARAEHHVGIDHVPAIVTREAVPEDFDRYFDEGFQELSAESRHLRFFTAVRELPDSVRAALREVDGHSNAAVIAFDAAVRLPDHPEGKAIGVARWMSGGDGPPELSISVIDAYQGCGVGTRLMDSLLALARRRGVRRIVADVLREGLSCSAAATRRSCGTASTSEPPALARCPGDHP